MPSYTATGIASTLAIGSPSRSSSRAVLGGIGPTSSVGAPTLFSSVGPTGQIFIDGVHVGTWLESSVRLVRRLNGRDQLSCGLHYTGGARPQPFKECLMLDAGTRRFGGVIEDYTESSVDAHNDTTRIDITASGYDSFFDDVVYNRTYLAADGATVASVLHDLWQAKLQGKGVSYTPGRDGDPAISLGAVAFQYITGTEVKNQLLARTPGWSIFIDENKELRLLQTNGIAANAPFSISDGVPNWEKVSVTISKSRMRNREYILTGKDGISQSGGSGVIETATIFVISGSLITYVSSHLSVFRCSTTKTVDAYGIMRSAPLFTVKVNGVTKNMMSMDDSSSAAAGQFDFYYRPNTNGPIGSFNGVIGNVGDVVTFDFSGGTGSNLGNSPEAIVVEDSASIAANGLVEAVYHPKTAVSGDFANRLGEGLITLNKDPSEQVTLIWNSKKNPNWVSPGMAMDINKLNPLMSGTYTVQEVSTQDYDKTKWSHTAILSKGPGDVTDVMQENELLVATRLPISPKQVILTFDLAGVDENITTGVSSDFSIMPTVLGGITPKGWVFITPASGDAPTGGSLTVDITVNASSIFSGSLPTIPASSTAQQSGFTFSAPDLRYFGGEIVRINVTSVGGTLPGKNAKLTLVLVG